AALGGTGHVVAGEVIYVGVTAVDEIRYDVTAHVMFGGLILRIILQRTNQRLGGEHIIAHGGEGDIWVIRGAGRIRRLLQEFGDVALVVGWDAAEGGGLWARYTANRQLDTPAGS